MGKSIARSVGAIVGLGLLLAACSGAKQTPDGGGFFAGGIGGSGGNAGSGGSASFCIAGSRRCDGRNVRVCDDMDAIEIIVQVCSESCSNGACVASTCVPNSQFCKDGAVWQCDAAGISSRGEECASGSFCRADGDSASCSSQACTPNQPTCAGDVATTCKSDGSGPVTGGVNCGDSKQTCYAGQCRDIACSNGSKLCDHGDVYLCAHNGADTLLLTDCHAGEVCDADAGACRAQVCDPGKVSCDGSRIQTCNAFGSAWLPNTTDCAADGKICVGASCKKPICTAGRSYCQDGNVFSCDASGTGATLTATCNALTEHCATYSSGSFAFCQTNSCEAGNMVCSDNMIKVCNADGTLPVSGTACGATQYCENAQCKDLGCTPGTAFCKNADIYYCDFNGSYLSQECSLDTACKTLGTGATCAPLACSPANSACLGNQIGTCAADGQSLSQVSTDCVAASSICTADLKCAKSATDAFGVAENAEVFSAGYVVGDVIDVTSTRKLSELQIQLVLAGPRELRWLVYELSGQTFVPKIDKIVSNVTGTGFISSGPFSFTLGAGKRYLLAVVISGGDAIDYIDTVPFPDNVSFGTVLGRVFSYYPSTIDGSTVDPTYVSAMKATTEVP